MVKLNKLGVPEFNYYECSICKKRYKIFGKWLRLHFIKKHNNSQLKLNKVFANG